MASCHNNKYNNEKVIFNEYELLAGNYVELFLRSPDSQTGRVLCNIEYSFA
jgi:hypothetical protein